MSENEKWKHIYKECLYLSLRRGYLQRFINRDFVFSIFTSFYLDWKYLINTLQLCVFALDTQYS